VVIVADNVAPASGEDEARAGRDGCRQGPERGLDVLRGLRGRQEVRRAVAGRLVPEKGTHVLLEALALLPPSLAQVRLRIAGDGPDRANLESLARNLGIGGRVEFLGHLSREEMERCLTGATVQVVPSIWAEPFGLVAIEAMARGTPVVVSGAGALRELVEEGRTGYLVPPGDARALAGRLAEVLAHPDGLASVRREARRVVSEAFSIEHAVDRFLDLYERVLNPAVATR